MILSLNENDAQEFKDWYINQPLAKGTVEVYGLVERGRISDTNVSRMLMASWDKETKKNTIDALASFASMSWDKELGDYALTKIRQINEGSI